MLDLCPYSNPRELSCPFYPVRTPGQNSCLRSRNQASPDTDSAKCLILDLKPPSLLYSDRAAGRDKVNREWNRDKQCLGLIYGGTLEHKPYCRVAHF